VARLIFFLLLCVNLALGVWSAGYLGDREDGCEPDRLRNQLSPTRLRVRVGDAPAEPGAAPAPAAATPRAPLVAGSCRKTTPMTTVEADALAKRVVAVGGNAALTVIEETNYWVYIPAVGGKPADKDIAVLKKSGFKEFSVVGEDGPNFNTVSFGLFPTEEAAQEKIARLLKNGVKSAKIAARVKPTGQAVLLVRGSPETLDKALTGIPTEAAECLKE
jgi:hypothetical protein